VTSGLQFSVVICAHNPRPDYLGRVLAHLDAQTYPRDQWELVLIDNLSAPPLSNQITEGISLPLRIVREETPGLVAARARGMIETSGAWLVYVDDDNLLNPNYLEELQRLILTHPHVALWSGEIRPEFEVQPPNRTKPFWVYLAIREVEGTQWSNVAINHTLPCGAGMAMRREVMTNWVNGIKTDAMRSCLGRKGNSLLAGEDTDIGLTAYAMGLGVGISNTMRLVHLIAARRIEDRYLRKIAYSVVYSHSLLDLVYRRVTFMGLLLRMAMFTRELFSRNRNMTGVTLWWAQVCGIASGWLRYKSLVKQRQEV